MNIDKNRIFDKRQNELFTPIRFRENVSTPMRGNGSENNANTPKRVNRDE